MSTYSSYTNKMKNLTEVKLLTMNTCFTKAFSVLILAFFMADTCGPTQTISVNFCRLLISSPVSTRRKAYTRSSSKKQSPKLVRTSCLIRSNYIWTFRLVFVGRKKGILINVVCVSTLISYRLSELAEK